MDTELAKSVSIVDSRNGDLAQPATSMATYRPDDRVFIQGCNDVNRSFICSGLEAAILGGIEGLA